MEQSNEERDLALSYVTQTRMSVFLTGKAGTGKTTFLRDLANHTSKRFVVLAPTGVAAVNAGGVTIHSFFQLPFSLLNITLFKAVYYRSGYSCNQR